MASKDLYAVLGVSRTASADEIRAEYRKLARKLHPDVNPGDKQAEARFKEVSAAYGVLSDAKKRKLYDEFGDVALQAGFDEQKAEQLRRMGGVGGTPFDFGSWSESYGQEAGFEDILGSIFGGRFGRRGPRRGADVQAELELDLPLAVRGGATTVTIPGRGQVEVKVPEGAVDGQTLRLSGLGQPGEAGAPAGDLYLRLKVAAHPAYRREGDDLHVEVPITVVEAVRGGKVSFPAPTGEVSLKLPPGTQSGQSFRLRGLGARGRGGEKGNLYARVMVVLPDGPPERLEPLAKAAEELGAGDVRAKLRF
ncbi:MAG: J domain-containing protein [Planctomycetota bacterium]|nr:J domain-containing protein [Planctomycetota bacterium]